jgi:hypothetical protein
MTEDRDENPDVPDRVSAGRDAYVAGRDINIHQKRTGGVPRWAAILAAVTVLAVTGVIIEVVAAARGPGQSPGPGPAEGGLSVQGLPWAITGGDRREETFTLGEPIELVSSLLSLVKGCLTDRGEPFSAGRRGYPAGKARTRPAAVRG